jgi:heme oxygenase
MPLISAVAAANRASMRALLRDATGDMHEALHRAPVFDRLATGSIDWEDYRQIMRMLAGFHFGIEAVRAEGARALAVTAENPRLALLSADLEGLGYDWSPRTHDETDPDRAVGCLYVVEGSVLGGRVLHRQLNPLFGARRDGRRFFEGPPSAGARWRETCQALDRYQPADPSRVVAGAVAAFDHFAQGLEVEG